MDGPCSYEEFRACVRDIAQVNRLTFAYRPTLAWLDYVYRRMPLQSGPLHIVDVGCGYGDMLRRIHRWAEDRNLPVRLTGIDHNPYAVRAAREVTLPGTITYLEGDAFAFHPPEGIDIIVSSLMTHHLTNGEIVDFLDWMESKARLGWFINDLHRERMPYRLFKLLCRFTTWHPFVKHDGPVSILRSFRRADWLSLCKAAHIPPNQFTLVDYRPARLCVARLR